MQVAEKEITGTLKAIEHTLSLIGRFNATIKLIKEKTPDDKLSLESHLQIKDRLVKDLAKLLSEFDLNIKVEPGPA